MDLVIGATGTLGGRIARTLVARGERVRALVRPASPARLERPHTSPEVLAAAGVELVAGDLNDPASLRRALDGVRRVVTSASASKRGDDPQATDHHGTARLIDAAARAGVDRFVYLSAQGADSASPVPLFAAKGAAEVHLHGSGIPWMVVRPAKFMEDWIGFLIGSQLAAGPRVVLVGDGTTRHAFVAETDVAAVVVAVLDRDDARNRTVELAGDVASYREVVATYRRLGAGEVAVTHVPHGAPVPGIPAGLSALWSALEQGPSSDPLDADRHAFGVPLQRVEAFVARSSAAATG